MYFTPLFRETPVSKRATFIVARPLLLRWDDLHDSAFAQRVRRIRHNAVASLHGLFHRSSPRVWMRKQPPPCTSLLSPWDALAETLTPGFRPASPRPRVSIAARNGSGPQRRTHWQSPRGSIRGRVSVGAPARDRFAVVEGIGSDSVPTGAADLHVSPVRRRNTDKWVVVLISSCGNLLPRSDNPYRSPHPTAAICCLEVRCVHDYTRHLWPYCNAGSQRRMRCRERSDRRSIGPVG